jgi:hypothetical protein
MPSSVIALRRMSTMIEHGAIGVLVLWRHGAEGLVSGIVGRWSLVLKVAVLLAIG